LNLVESERCNQENLEKFEATAKAAEVATATTNQTTADADKLEKLKAAYQKLRADHITLIREKADMEKQLKESSEEKASKNQEIFLEINNLLGKYSFLKSNSASNMSEIKECSLDLDANIAKYTKSAEEKDKIIAQKESDMRLLEFNCSERSL
jgi:seryl-tRNA synthetase